MFSLVEFAVYPTTAIGGICLSLINCLIFMVSSYPSITGMLQSVKTNLYQHSQGFCSYAIIISIASYPFKAKSTLYPIIWITYFKARILNSSSSTIKTWGHWWGWDCWSSTLSISRSIVSYISSCIVVKYLHCYG